MSGMVMALSSLTAVVAGAIAHYGSLSLALQGLSAAFLAAAKSALVFLATNPAGWAILAAAAIGGLVYTLTRVDDSAARAAANLKRIKQAAAGMAAEFGQSLERTANRWMTDKDKTFQGEKGEGRSKDQALARLERRRKASQSLAKDMAEIREQMKAIWDEGEGYGAWVMSFFLSGEAEFDRKSLADSLLGKKDGAWDSLLRKHRIDPKAAEEIGFDTTKSWAANELALQRYIEEYDRLIVKMEHTEAWEHFKDGCFFA